MTHLYGIPNCDTVKKARAWLDAAGVDHLFHDLRKQVVPLDHLERWVDRLGWETVLNRRGTTWRQLDAAERDGVRDAASAMVLMRAHPTLIRRPVVEWPDGRLTIGFDVSTFTAAGSG